MPEIPILRIGDCLLVSIQVDMHDRLALALQDDLTQRIVTDRARGVMIDISALEIVDSFIGRMLNNIAAMSKVLRRSHRRRWHAPGRCHHPGRAGSRSHRRPNRPECGQGPGPDPAHHR